MNSIQSNTLCTYVDVGFVAFKQMDFFVAPRPLLEPERLCDV